MRIRAWKRVTPRRHAIAAPHTEPSVNRSALLGRTRHWFRQIGDGFIGTCRRADILLRDSVAGFTGSLAFRDFPLRPTRSIFAMTPEDNFTYIGMPIVGGVLLAIGGLALLLRRRGQPPTQRRTGSNGRANDLHVSKKRPSVAPIQGPAARILVTSKTLEPPALRDDRHTRMMQLAIRREKPVVILPLSIKDYTDCVMLRDSDALGYTGVFLRVQRTDDKEEMRIGLGTGHEDMLFQDEKVLEMQPATIEHETSGGLVRAGRRFFYYNMAKASGAILRVPKAPTPPADEPSD